MKLIRLIALIVLLLTQQKGYSQFSKYIIRFKDKNNSPYSLNNPSQYLSARAIQRRTNYNIAIDSTDLPVNPAYIQAVLNTGAVTLINRSKWLNAITIQTTDANALTAINNLSFVKSTNAVALRRVTSSPVKKFDETITPLLKTEKTNGVTADYYNYGSGAGQIQLTNGQFLHNIGLRGQSMTMSLLDGGFFGYLTNTAFDSARNNNQFLGTWDFVANEIGVNEDNAHGTNCLSEICANWPGILVGTAPKAKFWLFRTEDVASEQPIEEYNWANGAEYADSVGTDVISSSVGYNEFDNPAFNHTYADMNGNTTPCTIAADLAAKKGILVVNSAGNSGNDAWHYIIAPADGKSVMAIGATTTSGVIASFSSYGPSYDGRVKPNVSTAGAGIIVANTNSQPAISSGTSFSCPNMAGLSACLWQGFPEFNNMKIIDAVQKSASKYTAPDDHYGYGIPNMKTAFGILLADYATSSASIANCQTTLNWTSKDLGMMRYEIERKLPGELNYIKIADINGQGSLLTTHNYQYTDTLNNTNTGVIYYRIKQVIDTTAATLTAVYLDSTSVTLANPCVTNTNNIIVYPNPVKKNMSVSVETKNAISKLYIVIYDINAKQVYREEKSKSPGKIIFNLSVPFLLSGEYIIAVYDDKKKVNATKFIKL
ncbi:MAG: T9SS type A sorting domain-containing protein [Sphingobacteriales bacterium]|nr:MAG: T9SS type A sorting domain-containing protein [Sphingobacteriales bacterium]